MSDETIWAEAVADICEQYGVVLSAEQADLIGRDMMHHADMMRECSSQGVASMNFVGEQRDKIEKLKAQVLAEKSKVICQSCNGTGQDVSHGPIHSSSSTCYKCNGEGRHKL